MNEIDDAMAPFTEAQIKDIKQHSFAKWPRLGLSFAL